MYAFTNERIKLALAEKPMNYDFVPSLQHMASVRILLAICNDKDIEQMLEAETKPPLQCSRFDSDKQKLKERIEKAALQKLSFLPDKLKIRLSKCILPIHKAICQWIHDHEGLLNLDASNCYLLCKNVLSWQTFGTINKIQTAKNLVGDKNFDANTRFAVACTYFLEDEVLSLWHGDLDVNAMRIPYKGTNLALRFWMEHLKKGSLGKNTWKAMIEEYFKSQRIQDWDTQTRISCFFPYLSWQVKKDYFPYLHGRHAHEDDLPLCVQSMSFIEREEFFRTNPAIILYFCLQWPHQELFMEMANRLVRHMSTDQIHAVLVRIIFRYIIMEEDFDYFGLLKEFWCLIPVSSKDEIQENTEFFKVIEATLNYDKENASLSLPKTIEMLFA